MKNITKLINKNFRIIFQPNDRDRFNGRRRFGVGAGQLHKYIGEHNANTSFEKALEGTDDRFVRRLRKEGSVTFYCK